MKIASLGIGALAVVALCGTAEAKRNAYAAGVDVQTTSGTGCLDSSSSAFTGVLQYDGLSGKTAALRVPLPSVGLVSTQILTVTAGLGTAHPSGSFTWKAVGPSGTLWNLSGTFQVTVTTVDANSYVFAMSETYGGCTENSYISATNLKPK
ncbi:MAG TPA: hypothetical protein VG889_21610 [Rhizomicrobium sp.]|nr:hypothetical protein [Rhizomicrobium sp.]